MSNRQPAPQGPHFNNDLLITPAGEIDRAFIAQAARVRALFRYGPDYTSADVAWWVETLTAMATNLQGKFHAGLFAPAANSEAA